MSADRVEEWRARVAAFVAGTVVPYEQAAFAAGVDDDLRGRLQAAARAAGVWAPQASAELGGGGFRLTRPPCSWRRPEQACSGRSR